MREGAGPAKRAAPPPLAHREARGRCRGSPMSQIYESSPIGTYHTIIIIVCILSSYYA